MKIKIFLCLITLFLSNCKKKSDLFSDTYLDGKYTNEEIGFSINVSNDDWKFYCSSSSMPGGIKDLQNDLYETGAELIFYGISKNGIFGTRGIVEPINLSLEDYYNVTYEKNKNGFENSCYDSVKINNIDMIDWKYNTDNFSFQEYQFVRKNCNIRVSFWTYTERFDEYQPIYAKIINSFNFIE